MALHPGTHNLNRKVANGMEVETVTVMGIIEDFETQKVAYTKEIFL